jgi:pimeloyl-ACP methyl ester carboxylesterase
VSLYAKITGDPSAPAVVFLHGVGTSGWMWWRQVPAFADHRCLNVDLPGHGRSRDVPWFSLAGTATQVAALVRAQTATGRAHVVGLSLGGHVALTLLEHHADVLERAVISGVTTEPWPRRWLLTPQVWLTTMLLRSRRLVDAQARSLGLPPEVRSAFAENVRAMTAPTYRRIAAEVAGYEMPRSLRAIETPTLVLAGGTESDAIRHAVDVLPATMPVATGRIVPGVGHGWNIEAPETFTATVRAWIEDAPLPHGLVQADPRRGRH